VESKPDNVVEDLRLHEPWAELAKFAESIKIEQLDSEQQAHVPFIVLLIQALQKWRSEHDGKVPETRQDKSLFKEAFSGDAENYEQAAASAFKAWTPFSVPGNVQEVLGHPKARNPPADASDFWLVVAAIARFVDKHQVLPLMGSIPDMQSDSNTYISLLSLYQAKVTLSVTDPQKRALTTLLKQKQRPLPMQRKWRAFCTRCFPHVRLVTSMCVTSAATLSL